MNKHGCEEMGAECQGLPESASLGVLDPERLSALQRTGLLDSASEEAFNRLTRMASKILNVPVALVSLVDRDRQYFKSQVGLPEPWATRRQTPLTHSFCQHVVDLRKPLVVPDARKHPLVRDNQAVPDLGVVAYAGIPLTTTDGQVLGAFCAIDGKVRDWGEDDLTTLRDLAAVTMTEVELRLLVRQSQSQAEAALAEKKQKELLLQAMDHGVFGLDGDGQCTFINEAAAAALGYEPRELLGRDLQAIISPDYKNASIRTRQANPLYRARADGKVLRGDDDLYCRKDGTTFPVEYVASPLVHGTQMSGTVVTFSNVTKRKQMHRRLAVQHAVSGVLAQVADFDEAALLLLETLGSALEWQVGSVWRVDEKDNLLRNVVTWSAPAFPATPFRQATEAMTFAPGIGLPGRVWQSRQPVWSVDILQETNFPRARLAADEGLHSAICFPILRGGEVKGVIEFFSDFRNQPDEELLQTVSTAGRQVGEFIARKKAERALVDSEARKGAIFNASLDAIIAIDHEGRILEWNPAAERIFGYRRGAVEGKEMAELIIPLEYRERHRQGIRHYLQTGVGAVLEKRIELTAMRSSGENFPVELAITRVAQAGPPTFLGFVRDITQRRQSEQSLLESERFARNVVDSLSSEIAILDDRGMILHINNAWNEFTKQNATHNSKAVGAGNNYLDVCDRAANRGSTDAAEFAEGIRAVIRGEQSLFEQEYPCHAPNQPRWFIARLTRFTGEGPARFVMAHENITKRKLAELEQERLARYNQLLLDSTGEGIYGLSIDGKCTFINSSAARLLGFQPGEALGKNMHELTHHTHADGSHCPASDCPIYSPFKTGEGCKVRNEVFWRQDGTSFPVEYSSYPLVEHTTVRGVVVVFSDISERLESERKLALLSLVASKTDNAVIICSSNHLIEWVNDGFTRITGYTAEEAIGHRPGQLLQGPLTDQKTIEAIRQQLGQKISFTEEILNYRKDGRPYWLSLNITPVLTTDGDVAQYIAVESDITERVQEEERQKEELRLSALAAEIGTAITKSNHLSGMLQRCSEALVHHLDGAFARIWTLNVATQMLELKASAGQYTHLDGKHGLIPMGKYKIGLIAQEQKPHLTNSVVGDPRVSDQEWAVREGIVSFAGYPLLIGGDVLGVVGLFARHPLTDSTLQALSHTANSIALGIQRMRASEELKKSKESAELANQAKSQFLANMSHELRTPLNAVIMYSELLTEEVTELELTEFVPDLNKIRNAGKHLLGLINNVLDLSKIEAGKMEVYKEQFDLGTMVSEVASMIQPLVEKRGNQLAVECSRELGSMFSDLTKVRQVLFNLLSNAAKFTEHSSIELHVKPESVGGEEGVAFYVRDRGIGMTEEQMERLFQTFSQADASTTRKYGGTGLGLAISKRLCQLLGGDIEVESQIGEGSTFIFRLPLNIPSSSPKEQV